MMPRLPLLLRANLYRLKRDYGAPVDIYKCLSADTDVQTGVRTVIVEVVHVPLAICLPATQRRKDSVSIQKTGLYDVCVRDFIVPRESIGATTQLTEDDWVVERGRRYQVARVEDYGTLGAWLITGRELIGEVPQQVIEVRAESVVKAMSHGE
jgi:hypothetical protein